MGIAGIVVTVLIAVLIYRLQKTRKYPGRLTASLISMSRVLEEKPEHYVDLTLRLGEYQIEKNLLYLEFLIFNERSYDIKADINDSYVTVLLPDNAKWVDVRVSKQSDGVDLS